MVSMQFQELYLSVKFPHISCTTVQITLMSILGINIVIITLGAIKDFIYKTITKMSDVIFPFIYFLPIG